MNEVEIFCPATIANVSCGFDVLGLCLDHIGERMVIRKNRENKLRIVKIEGANLSSDINENVAGVAGLSLLRHLNSTQGFDIEIYKQIAAGSGIGSSAASSAGAVFGINYLLGSPLSPIELVPFSMKGEGLASGSEHADNVAPALLGGLTLIRNHHPLDIISLPLPGELQVSIIHPKIELRTADARAVLRKNIPLKDAVTQWGNLAAFISAIHTEDYSLLSRAMNDCIVEPVRSLLIPFYNQIKALTIERGAIGTGISGSGPSIFSFSRGKETAEKVLKAMSQCYENSGIGYDLYLSKISKQGVNVISAR